MALRIKIIPKKKNTASNINSWAENNCVKKKKINKIKKS